MSTVSPESPKRIHAPILKQSRQASSVARSFYAAAALFGLLWIVAAGTPASAQTNIANITGTVSDQTGAAIPNATVTATDTQTGIVHTQTTDAAGRYTITNLPPGSYNIQAAAQGFSSVQRLNQQLLVDTTASLPFTLPVSSISQTVSVTTAAPLLNPTENVLSTVVQTQQMDNLPIINRSFASLAQLSPGVQVTPANGSSTSSTVQFGDAGTFENGFIVDGGSIQKYDGGGQLLNFAQDWIQEFSVITQQAPAQYSLSSAGFINAITRSGGNDVHGRAYGYFQNAALNAKPSFLPASAPNKPPYNQQRVGGFVGGPITKNKLFYFLGYEFFNNLTSTPVNIPVAFAGPATTSGVYPVTTKEHLALAKLDYQITPTQAIHLRANEDYSILGNTGIGASGSVVQALGSGSPSWNDNNVYQATWDHILSPSLLNELRVEYAHNYYFRGCNLQTILGPYTGGGPNANPWGDPTGYYATVTYSGAGVADGCPALYGHQGERSWTFEDDVSITRGNHQIKFGVDAGNHNLYNRGLNRYANGQYTMPGTLTTPINPMQPSSFPLTYLVAWEPGNFIYCNLFGPFFGLFGQDSWKVTANLTLNLGVRYDYNFGNSMIQTLPNLNPIQNDPTNFAPRLGFAWKLPHHNDTVIRGGFGVYYDEDLGNTAATYYTSNIAPTSVLNYSANTASLNPYCYGNSACASVVPAVYQTAVEAVLAYALLNYQLPNFTPPGGQITIGGKNYVIPALTSATPTAIYNFVENFKNPGTMQTTLGAAQQLGDSLEFSGDFVYTHGFNELIFYNANLNPATYQPIYPQYTSISQYNNAGFFNSYSLRAQGHYRNRRGDGAQVAYTLSYGWDNTPNAAFQLTTVQTQATDPFNFNVDYGPADIPRNNLNISGIGALPLGFELNPIIAFSSGLPYTATTTSRLITGCPAYYQKCYPTGYSKGSLTGGSIFNLNARLSKSFAFHDRYTAKLMFEGYNLTNRVNYSAYQANSQSTAFKQPIGADPRRQLQLAFQFDF